LKKGAIRQKKGGKNAAACPSPRQKQKKTDPGSHHRETSDDTKQGETCRRGEIWGYV